MIGKWSVAVALALLTVPVAQAALWDDWGGWLPEWAEAPEPEWYTYGTDLTTVLGKHQVTTLSAITGLNVLTYPDFDVYITPDATVGTQQTEFVIVSNDGVGPSSSTFVDESTTYKLLTDSVFVWIDGAGTNPAELDTDPSYIFSNSVADVSVPWPHMTKGIAPTRLVGTGSMVTAQVARDLGRTGDTLGMSFLDVDSNVAYVETAPAYAGTPTITSATTTAAIQTLLEAISIDGTTIDGILSGLLTSPEKIGILNLAGVATYLNAKGFTVRSIIGGTPAVPSVVNYVLPLKQIDFVNPDDLLAPVAFATGTGLAAAADSRVTALKPEASGEETVMGIQRLAKTTGDYCFCDVTLRFASNAGGYSRVYAAAAALTNDVEKVLMTVHVDPLMKGPYLAPGTAVDMNATDASLRYVYFKDAGAVTTRKLSTAYMQPAPDSTVSLYPQFARSGFALFNEAAATAVKYNATVADSVASWTDKYGEIYFAACREGCLHALDYQGIRDAFTQLELFDPRALVVAPDTVWDDAVLGVLHNSTGAFGYVTNQAGVDDLFRDAYTVLTVRALQERTFLPVSDAVVQLNVYLPGWKGGSTQTQVADTNSGGYASFHVLPHTPYNLTVTAEGFRIEYASGATGAPAESTGEDVEMHPTEGWRKVAERIGDPWVVTSLLVLTLGLFWMVLRAKARRSGRRA